MKNKTENKVTAKTTVCHHCGKQIVWNQHGIVGGGHWAHAILVFNGESHSLENALMEQRCSDGIHWATPKRSLVPTQPQPGKATITGVRSDGTVVVRDVRSSNNLPVS